ncbi:MAG: hypothetical protein IKI64_06565 [Clostridia bacterium]|nr:hypothetical protein [Clostridia bacterium]
MVSILFGSKGMGKSRRLIEMANDAYTQRGENSVFIDNDDDRMYLLDRGIRFINASEYTIDGPKMFSGFISGIAAQDFDLQRIYINSFMKIVKHPVESLELMFCFLSEFSDRMSVDLVISISSEDEPPEFLRAFII